MSDRDIQIFLNLCLTPGRKPVPFIPILDDSFETYFKKDSLWQSEDLEAVVDRDVGKNVYSSRPVAVRHTTTVNEPVSQILDGVHDGIIAALKKQSYDNDTSRIPKIGYFSGPLHSRVEPDRTGASISRSGTTHYPPHISQAPSPDSFQWVSTFSGNESSWMLALLGSDKLVVGDGRCVPNIFRRLLAPASGLSIHTERDLREGTTIVRAHHDQEEILRIKHDDSFPGHISVEMFNPVTASGPRAALHLEIQV